MPWVPWTVTVESSPDPGATLRDKIVAEVDFDSEPACRTASWCPGPRGERQVETDLH